ncbi:hypothetical protein L1D55_25155 [Vibrio sp. Isolate22]|uniref:hypothetical protein n=1 Tax=Vibrio sp. Isolate22 TaxID=2908532 RepID=UPI001EFC8E52|nr:hypothetical protein [Vibrio sp. Isolate22]MCG9694953.1 hypothetical protein [Vibrio sp. Isolate22]
MIRKLSIAGLLLAASTSATAELWTDETTHLINKSLEAKSAAAKETLREAGIIFTKTDVSFRASIVRISSFIVMTGDTPLQFEHVKAQVDLECEKAMDIVDTYSNVSGVGIDVAYTGSVSIQHSKMCW